MEESFSSKPRVWFEVEKIVGVSTDGGNGRSYKVQWAPAWVSSFHLAGCENLIQEFLQQRQDIAEKTNEVLHTSNELSQQQWAVDIDKSSWHGENSVNAALGEHYPDIVSTENTLEEENDLVEHYSKSNKHVGAIDYNSELVEDNNDIEHLVNDTHVACIDHDKCHDSPPSGIISRDRVDSKTEADFSGAVLISKARDDSSVLVKVEVEDDETSETPDAIPTYRIENSQKLYTHRQYPYLYPQRIDVDNARHSRTPNEPFDDQNSLDIHPRICINPNIYTYRDTFVRENERDALLQNDHIGKPYSCYMCAKTFSTCASMRSHMRTHNTFKPHICEFCHKAFHKRSNLKVHLRIHTGERPFTCSQCRKGFTTLANCTKHSQRCIGD